jgi:hypothetical protein
VAGDERSALSASWRESLARCLLVAVRPVYRDAERIKQLALEQEIAEQLEQLRAPLLSTRFAA